MTKSLFLPFYKKEPDVSQFFKLTEDQYDRLGISKIMFRPKGGMVSIMGCDPAFNATTKDWHSEYDPETGKEKRTDKPVLRVFRSLEAKKEDGKGANWLDFYATIPLWGDIKLFKEKEYDRYPIYPTVIIRTKVGICMVEMRRLHDLRLDMWKIKFYIERYESILSLSRSYKEQLENYHRYFDQGAIEYICDEGLYTEEEVRLAFPEPKLK